MLAQLALDALASLAIRALVRVYAPLELRRAPGHRGLRLRHALLDARHVSRPPRRVRRRRRLRRLRRLAAPRDARREVRCHSLGVFLRQFRGEQVAERGVLGDHRVDPLLRSRARASRGLANLRKLRLVKSAQIGERVVRRRRLFARRLGDALRLGGDDVDVARGARDRARHLVAHSIHLLVPRVVRHRGRLDRQRDQTQMLRRVLLRVRAHRRDGARKRAPEPVKLASRARALVALVALRLDVRREFRFQHRVSARVTGDAPRRADALVREEPPRAHERVAVATRDAAERTLLVVRRRQPPLAAVRAPLPLLVAAHAPLGVLAAARHGFQRARRPVPDELADAAAPGAQVRARNDFLVADGDVLRQSVLADALVAPGDRTRDQPIRTRRAVFLALMPVHHHGARVRVPVPAVPVPARVSERKRAPRPREPARVLVRAALRKRHRRRAPLRLVRPAPHAGGAVHVPQAVSAQDAQRGDALTRAEVGGEVVRAEHEAARGVRRVRRRGVEVVRHASPAIREPVVRHDGIQENVAARAAGDVRPGARDEHRGHPRLVVESRVVIARVGVASAGRSRIRRAGAEAGRRS